LRVGKVGGGGAVFLAVVFLPVLHEQAFHLIPLLQQQVRGTEESTPPDMPTITFFWLSDIGILTTLNFEAAYSSTRSPSFTPRNGQLNAPISDSG
jgi:hypothetical protein